MRLLATATALMLTVGTAQAETQVRVHYAIPTIWADVQQMLADAFM
jgi:multiple sugar transport system substrate-binding protein